MIRDTCDKTSKPVADPTLGGLLRSLRRRAKITQKQLGLALGKPARWVGRIERQGRCMDLVDFIRWCESCHADSLDAIAMLENTPLSDESTQMDKSKTGKSHSNVTSHRT